MKAAPNSLGEDAEFSFIRCLGFFLSLFPFKFQFKMVNTPNFDFILLCGAFSTLNFLRPSKTLL